MKRILSLIFAFAMLLNLTVSAFASSTEGNGLFNLVQENGLIDSGDSPDKIMDELESASSTIQPTLENWAIIGMITGIVFLVIAIICTILSVMGLIHGITKRQGPAVITIAGISTGCSLIGFFIPFFIVISIIMLIIKAIVLKSMKNEVKNTD